MGRTRPLGSAQQARGTATSAAFHPCAPSPELSVRRPNRDTAMDTTSDAAEAQPTTVAFVNCFNGSTFDRAVCLTADEVRRLRTY